MSNLLLQKIVLLRVTEVGKIIQKKKRPLLLARSVVVSDQSKTVMPPLVPFFLNISSEMNFLCGGFLD